MWRQFGKINVDSRQVTLFVSDNQRIKASIDFADDEEILESFLSLEHFIERRREWATQLTLAAGQEDLFILFENLQHKLQSRVTPTTPH